METSDKDALTTLKENGKNYWEVMSISIVSVDNYNKLKNSKDCIENPNTPFCPNEPYLKDSKNVYMISYGQDSPNDPEFQKKTYMFNSSNIQDLDFKTHFEKYFKLELLNR